MPPRSKYAPLAAYLAAQPPATARVTLTLAEVMMIIGQPLPLAGFTQTWWSNGLGRARQREWVTAEWRVTGTRLRIDQPTITFSRAA